jgi:Ca-activated chloride channel homolog
MAFWLNVASRCVTPNSRVVLSGLLLVAALFVVPFSFGQGSEMDVHVAPPKEAEKPKPPTDLDPSLKTHTKPIMVDVDLVLINVTVTDPMNRLVTGLEKENFVIFEGNSKQHIRHFSSEDAPLSLGVIFDISGSMKDKIIKAREAVVEFFRTANPQDEFFLVTFADKPDVLSDFTSSIEDIQGRLVYAVPKGRTSLLDAVYLGMNKMRDGQNSKKALLIISDGGDNRSRYTEGEIKTMVKESDVQIYAIGIYDPYAATDEERHGPALLGEITEVTGGRAYTLSSPNELADTATKIGMELRNQYVLGYRPTNVVRDGKWRKVKVKLMPPKELPPLHVYARTGYYAPTE